jgi:hypothetical protein
LINALEDFSIHQETVVYVLSYFPDVINYLLRIDRMNVKGKALLFGLNYAHCKSGKLNGCINDVQIMSKYIQSLMNVPVAVYTDDVDRKSTSYDGIIEKLYDLAIESYRENLEFVWIHYSGHGSYQKDVSGDEKDGYDEGLVPSDYEIKGILIDDLLNKIFNSFNPKTRVLFVCDACHSGSMLDLTYTWDANKKCTTDNPRCAVRAPTMLISGCMDNQTSADAYNLMKDNKYVGALTASILNVLRKRGQYIYDVFALVEAVRSELQRGGFKQYPCLSSNYDINKTVSVVPIVPKQTQQPQTMQQASHYRPSYYESYNTFSRSVNTQPVQPMMQQAQPMMQQAVSITYIPVQITHVPYVQGNTYGYGMCI